MVARAGVGSDLVVDAADLAMLEERQQPVSPGDQDNDRVAVPLGEVDHARGGGEAVVDMIGPGQHVAAGRQC